MRRGEHGLRPGSGRAAFTLIEVLVVVTIIAVVATLFIRPMTGSVNAVTLRESGRHVLLSARYARGYAVTRGRECRLAVNQQTGEYRVEAELDPRQPGRFQTVRADLNRPRILPKTVRFAKIAVLPRGQPVPAAPDWQSVTFTPTGEADAALIEVTDGDRSLTVRIAPGTGRADLVEGADAKPPADRIDLDV